MRSLFYKKSIEDVLQGRNKHLHKNLGAMDLVLLGIGAIVGIGILVLTGLLAAKYAGPSVVFSFVFAAAVCTLVAFCYAELASAIPTSGGVYTYSYVTIGEFVAFLMGWSQMLMYVIAVAAVANGWSAYFISLLTGFGIHLPKALHTVPSQGGIVNIPAIVVILLITWVLTQGAKESKRMTNMMVGVKLFIILLFIVVGVFYVKPANWHPFMPFGFQGVIAGAATAFFAFLGFDAVAAAAEEVKQPKRDLPIGIIGSLIVCLLLYISVSLVMTGMVPYQLLGVSDAMAFALQKVGQNFVAGILSVGALAGIMTVIIAYLHAGVRMLFAMSRDRLLPPSFSQMRSVGTPLLSTILLGVLASILGGFIDLQALSDLINMVALLTFFMVACAVLLLRRTQPNLPRGFKVPFVPYFPIIVMISCLFLITKLTAITWLYFIVWIVVGCVVYLLQRKAHQ